jgi:hypothetical protein
LSQHEPSPAAPEQYSALGLAQSYAWLGQRLLTYDKVPDLFEALTSVAVRQVPGAEDAGITRSAKGGPMETLAPTSDLVSATDRIQYELDSGPCIDAIRSDGVVRAGDLRGEPRWAELGHRAYDATGVQSMLSFRLYLEEEDDVVTGLNLYSRKVEAFSMWSQTVGLLLATHGALALANARAHERNDHLNRALLSNREIGVAIGILMATHQISRDDALGLLRIASQHTNRKLADIASEVADAGELALPTLEGVRSKRG